MRYKLKKTAAMVGMMGAGKTAVGRSVADTLGVPFLDSDAEIVNAANMEIAEIFERYGEPFFRARESEVLSRLLAGTPVILSTGGGAFMGEANRQHIHDLGVSVWLKADLPLLWSRVRHKTTRPLLKTADPFGTLSGIFEARVPQYSKADLTVETRQNYTIEQTAERVIETLLTRPDVLEEVP